ncbi:MAG: penicillin acylase family protein, partial [Ferruginibacter sp.]
MKYIIFCLLTPLYVFSQPASNQIVSWRQQAKNISIIRDQWGIPHIYGKTDADAVFGLLYAQCEDDFKRVELNYIEKLGRLAEVKGKSELYNDLLIRLIIDSTEAIADYNKSPQWLKKLLVAYADGINFYLYSNPSVKPLLLTNFKPWYPLLWTDGSIGAISTGGLTAADVEKFYSGSAASVTNIPQELPSTGSNGFAFAPSITESKKAILYINPHVTFYFRPEVHVQSEEGLHVYGAVTWGQFFIYQGFNEKCGWMHTSSDVDVADVYAEQTIRSGTGYRYVYNGSEKKVMEKNISLRYLSSGSIITKKFKVFYTHHGPVMGMRDGKLLTVKSNNRSINGLVQSWERTKAKSFKDYQRVMNLKANTSNNTVYADAEGNIAYWHGNFIPKRNPSYNWAKPVDGSISETEWNGLHNVNESVHLYNPPNGWLQNCNSTPFTVAGENSPKPQDYPRYMAPDGENYRAINAARVLAKEKNYTLDKVIAAGYDTYLAAFEKTIPALVHAYDGLATTDSLQKTLQQPIAILRNWNLRVDTNSIATTLAIEWGTSLLPLMVKTGDEMEYAYVDQVKKTDNFLATARPQDLLNTLNVAVNALTARYGNWQIPWGAINRFQRISPAIEGVHSDDKPSYPVAFASATWGMLPAYASAYFKNTKLRYGVHGNSFVCAVEFGDKIKAKSLLAGGESGNPNSKNFADQAYPYSIGQFKDV